MLAPRLTPLAKARTTAIGMMTETSYNFGSLLSGVCIAFGPVPSRRLGRSLGINHIPPKYCSYSCAYCQLGSTTHHLAEQRSFYPPSVIVEAVKRKLDDICSRGEIVDYLTFVANGEPTLDANLGRLVRDLRPLGIKTAVITNGSLIDQEQIQEDLAAADWVSVKVDAVSERIWRRLNRPHRTLRLVRIMRGVQAFSRQFKGILVTETMLIAGVNDGDKHVTEIAAFLADVRPSTAYLAIPTRPPAKSFVRPSTETAVNRAYQLINERLESVECLLGYEGNAFATTGDPMQDLLSITAVHPMKEEAVKKLLEQTAADWSAVRNLVEIGKLVEIRYGDETFYLRNLNSI